MQFICEPSIQYPQMSFDYTGFQYLNVDYPFNSKMSIDAKPFTSMNELSIDAVPFTPMNELSIDTDPVTLINEMSTDTDPFTQMDEMSTDTPPIIPAKEPFCNNPYYYVKKPIYSTTDIPKTCVKYAQFDPFCPFDPIEEVDKIMATLRRLDPNIKVALSCSHIGLDKYRVVVNCQQKNRALFDRACNDFNKFVLPCIDSNNVKLVFFSDEECKIEFDETSPGFPKKVGLVLWFEKRFTTMSESEARLDSCKGFIMTTFIEKIVNKNSKAPLSIVKGGSAYDLLCSAFSQDWHYVFDETDFSF